MILITVGSSNFKFDRLFKIIDELCEEKILDSNDIVAQTGKIDYKIKKFNHFEFDSNANMSKFQDDANYIICHSGTGTVVNSLKKGKKVIVFPRLQKYNEHTDNHQLDLCNSFYDLGFILKAQNKEELIIAIHNICDFKPQKFISNTSNFLALLTQEIEK